MAAAGGIAGVEDAGAALAAGDLADGYLRRMRERFGQASAAGDLASADLCMAGLSVRLSFAGSPMREALLPPFEHLAVEGEPEAHLSILAFDTASTGVEPPPRTWQPLEAAAGTNPVARLRSERACVLAGAGTGATTAVDLGAGEAIFHLPDAGRIPASERAAPLRDALQLLMAQHARWTTHAGAVGREGCGVLLVGPGGSGKSTLALSCALAGMEIAADDYVLLESGPLFAHAMQSTAKLTEDSAARLDLDASAIDPAGFEPTLEGPSKALVDIRTIAPGQIRRRLKIGALVAPTVGVGGAVVRLVSAGEGLRGVAPSTVVQSGMGGGEALAALADLVRRVPCYSLALSPDPKANAAAVDELVAELG